jgi:tetratricopeptide (TPR) repeat protein
MQHGDLAGAIALFTKVVDNTQDERSKAIAFINMGNIQKELGNLPAARDNFKAAIDLRPRNVRAWIGLGVTTQKSGDYTAAIQAYSQAVSLQPTDLTYLLLAGALKRSGRDAEAVSATQTAKQLSQNITQTQQFVDKLLAH